MKRRNLNKFRLERQSHPWPLRYQCSDDYHCTGDDYFIYILMFRKNSCAKYSMSAVFLEIFVAMKHKHFIVLLHTASTVFSLFVHVLPIYNNIGLCHPLITWCVSECFKPGFNLEWRPNYMNLECEDILFWHQSSISKKMVNYW